AAVPEHRICLAERLDDPIEIGTRDVEGAGKQLRFLSAMGKEFMQGWIEQTYRNGQPVHCLEDPLEVGALHWQQLIQRPSPSALLARHDHLAHRRDAVALEKHVLRSAQPNSFCAKASRDARVTRSVGVRANAKPAHLVGPAEQLGIRLVKRRLCGWYRTTGDTHNIARNR